MTRLVEIGFPDGVLERARSGDEQAQAEIYAAVAPATFALIRRLVGHQAVAEDLFQDTLMTLFQRLPDFRGEAPLGAWLRQIAISKCLMYLRSPWHRARLRLEGSLDEGGPAHDLVWPAIPALRAESLDVHRALESLSPTARMVVWLYEVEGYSHDEIGRAFGRSISFSKSQLARAHVRLRAWFEPKGGEKSCTPI